MSDLHITVSGTKRLLTAGKRHDHNIVITAEGNYYDTFWDGYQEKGNRTHYGGAFAGTAWDDSSFRPKYAIKPDMADYMFAFSQITDLPAALAAAGITLDFSNAQECTYLFRTANIQRTGVLDCSGCRSLNNLFYNAKNLETVDKLIIANDIVSFTQSMFYQCTALKNITFEGVMPFAVSFEYSPLLTAASVNSIIGVLKDLTGQAAKTLTFHPDVGSNLTAAQKAAITAKNWTLVY